MEGQYRFNYVSECFWEHEAEGWMGALMKIKELVHKSKSKVSDCVGISMRFAYQGMSRIQGSKKMRSKELDIEDLFSTEEVCLAQV